MTITINETFLYYWLCAIVFETIYSYVTFKVAWKKFKENTEVHERVMMMVNHLKQSANIRLIWKVIFNPASYTIGYLIFCFITPLLAPLSLVTLVKKIFGYKTPLEKKAEEEEKEIEQSQRRSKEWMEKEGDVIDIE